MEDDGDHESDKPKIEILESSENNPTINTNIAALINEYTERPDLFLAEMEKHDPGFIKRMNEEMERSAKKSRDSRFKFGRFQAYTSVAVSVLSMAAIFCLLWFTIEKGLLSFWVIIAFAIFYAISQSGAQGFLAVIESLKNLFSKTSKDED